MTCFAELSRAKPIGLRSRLMLGKPSIPTRSAPTVKTSVGKPPTANEPAEPAEEAPGDNRPAIKQHGHGVRLHEVTRPERFGVGLEELAPRALNAWGLARCSFGGTD